MSDATIVEILLAVLAAAITFGSFVGANRAGRIQNTGTLADIDAQAFESAKSIYESAIGTLGTHIGQLKDQIGNLDTEVTRLQQANRELRSQVVELQVANHRLEMELHGIRDGRYGNGGRDASGN